MKEHLTHVFTTEDTEGTEVNLVYDYGCDHNFDA